MLLTRNLNPVSGVVDIREQDASKESTSKELVDEEKGKYAKEGDLGAEEIELAVESGTVSRL